MNKYRIKFFDWVMGQDEEIDCNEFQRTYNPKVDIDIIDVYEYVIFTETGIKHRVIQDDIQIMQLY